MTINVLGVNHKSAPIDIREKLVFDKHSIPKALEDIKNIEGVNEVVLISTCNRTEIYTENDIDNSKIIKWLSANQNSVKDCEPFMYNYSEEKAIKHLFNVASGVDSMVIGENEILGQVKDAFKIADKNNCIKSSLKKLFEFSFSVAKQVRTKTDIGVAVLFDDRYSHNKYKSLFPLFWDHYKTIGKGQYLQSYLEQFWKSKK